MLTRTARIDGILLTKVGTGRIMDATIEARHYGRARSAFICQHFPAAATRISSRCRRTVRLSGGFPPAGYLRVTAAQDGRRNGSDGRADDAEDVADAHVRAATLRSHSHRLRGGIKRRGRYALFSLPVCYLRAGRDTKHLLRAGRRTPLLEGISTSHSLHQRNIKTNLLLRHAHSKATLHSSLYAAAA